MILPETQLFNLSIYIRLTHLKNKTLICRNLLLVCVKDKYISIQLSVFFFRINIRKEKKRYRRLEIL